MNRSLVCSLSAICVLFFSGCMVVRGPAFKDMQPTLTSKATGTQPLATPRIQVMVNAKHYANGQPSPQTSTKSDYEKVFDTVFGEQRLFKEIGLQVRDAEWEVVVDIREEEHFNIANVFVSACTLLVIPAVDTVTMQATAKVLDAHGEQIAALDARQDIKVFIDLLLLLPWRVGIAMEAQRNLARDIVLQLNDLAAKKGMGAK